MKSAIRAQDILNDIEFELIQGAIRQDELGQSIQTVRKFHNDLRSELLASVQNVQGGRDIVTRQSQLNDMLITLLQEMSNELLSLRQQQRQLNGWVQHNHTQGEAPTAGEPSTPLMATDSVGALSLAGNNGHPSLPPLPMPALPVAGGRDQELARSMRREALGLSLDVRPVPIPLIGWAFQKIRALFHSLAFFYAQRLGERQAQINRIYGERLLSLAQQNAEYQRRLETLAAEVERLRNQSAE